MKSAISLILAAFLFTLLLTPAMVFAAGTITFTSPTAGSSFKGTQSYTIAGTVSPVPTQPDNVFIQVKNPSGKVVDAASVPVSLTNGAFSYSTATGGSSDWTSGTYTITATDTFGATGTTTFQYTAVTPPPAGVTLNVQVQAASPVYAGQTVQVMALVFWNNGTLVQSTAKVTAHYHDPSGTPHQLGAGMLMATGMYMWTISLPANAADGLYTVMVMANKSNVVSWGSAGFTVNSQIASAGSLKTIQTDLMGNFSSLSKALSSLQASLSTLASSVSTIQSTLNGLSSTASSLSSTLTSIQNSLTTLGNTASSLSSQLGTVSSKVDNAATQASNAASAIGTTQLYVLIVAVIAAITLVLELAILVRKLS